MRFRRLLKAIRERGGEGYGWGLYEFEAASARLVAEQSENYRYSTNHQVVIDADPRLVVANGQSATGALNAGKA